MKSFSKKEREQIFKLFLDKEKLTFTDIERAINIRSNMVAYHISCLQQEGLLKKEGEHYALTRNAEKYIPIFPHITGESLSPLPVVIIAPVYKDKIFLINRTKRPYKGYWGLVGGKMLFEETLESSALRKLREYTTMQVKNIQLSAIAQERVMDEGIVKHSFILFFARADVEKDDYLENRKNFFSIKKLEKMKVIPSDLWLTKKKLHARVKMKQFILEEKNGEYGFEIVS